MYCAWVVRHKYGQFQNQHTFWGGYSLHSNGWDGNLFLLGAIKTTECGYTDKKNLRHWLWSKIAFHPTTTFLADFLTNVYSCNFCLVMKPLKRVQAFNFINSNEGFSLQGIQNRCNLKQTPLKSRRMVIAHMETLVFTVNWFRDRGLNVPILFFCHFNIFTYTHRLTLLTTLHTLHYILCITSLS